MSSSSVAATPSLKRHWLPRALAPGRYEFFDDFNKSTKGTLVVQ